MSANGAEHFPPPQNPDDPGRGPLIMELTWTFTTISILALAVRFHVRRKSRMLWWDDWIMLLALICQVGAQACMTRAYLWGLGKHDLDITVDPQLINIQKWNYITIIPSLLASSVARISAAILLIRLFGSKTWFKWYLIVFTSTMFILVVAAAPVLWTQSKPVEAIWNPFVKTVPRSPLVRRGLLYTIQGTIVYPPSSGAGLLTVAVFANFACLAMLTFSDLTYLLFPTMFVYKLNMPLRGKMGLVILMMLSLVTMTLSLLKTIQIKVSVASAVDNTQDTQYRTSIIQVWSGVEQSLVITLSCVPTLRTWASTMAADAFHSMRSNLARILPSRFRGDTNNRSSSDQYFDLELQPPTLQQHPHASTASTGDQSSVTGNQIRQTNALTISTVSLISKPPTATELNPR
ncbi:hypothetical protein PG984_003105 [Apiospora sp. TS-2023a]